MNNAAAPREQMRSPEMTPEKFSRKAEADGYTVVAKSMEPGTVNPDHSHPFDVRLLITDGEITVSVDGNATTCRASAIFELEADRMHAEVIGTEGVSFLAARR